MIRPSRRGAAFFLVVLGVIVMTIGLAVVLPRANNDVQRAKEDELRFALGEYRRAVDKFTERWQRPPRDFSELLADANGVPHLRRVYVDPFTRGTDWQWETVSGTVRIHSISSHTSLAGVPVSAF